MKTASQIITAFLLCTIISCSFPDRPNISPQKPLYLGVAYDVSGSVEELELPVMTMQHVEKIVSLVKKRGGAVGLGLIDEKAFEPLTRLELERVAGKLNERARINQKNAQAESEFKALVDGKINRPRNARRTDIKGSIARFALFFGEPTIPADAEKLAIFISDGIDTGPWRKLSGIRLPEDVKVFVVGMERGLAEKLFGKQAILFESIDAAIESLNSKSAREPRS